MIISTIIGNLDKKHLHRHPLDQPDSFNHNCHCDICLGNICPGNISPYKEYLSCYWRDFYQREQSGERSCPVISAAHPIKF